MIKRVESYFFYAMMMVIVSAIAKESREVEKIKQVSVGNFALPGSQQPGPLFSFGQNILDKGIAEAFGYVDQAKGSQYNFVSFTPSFLYGITDRLSLLVGLPMVVHFQHENTNVRGPQDFRLQLEGSLYVGETTTTINEITAVANIGVPTGSTSTNPTLGFGSPSFFFGFTGSHVAPRWWYFASSGILLPTAHKNNQYGNQFLYQAGLGRNIAYSPNKWIFNALLEFDGVYTQRSRVCGITLYNSGGNILYLAPSLWLSTRRVFMQIGIAVVIFEHLFGDQVKNSYVFAAGLGWRF